MHTCTSAICGLAIVSTWQTRCNHMETIACPQITYVHVRKSQMCMSANRRCACHDSRDLPGHRRKVVSLVKEVSAVFVCVCCVCACVCVHMCACVCVHMCLHMRAHMCLCWTCAHIYIKSASQLEFDWLKCGSRQRALLEGLRWK